MDRRTAIKTGTVMALAVALPSFTPTQAAADYISEVEAIGGSLSYFNGQVWIGHSVGLDGEVEPEGFPQRYERIKDKYSEHERLQDQVAAILKHRQAASVL